MWIKEAPQRTVNVSTTNSVGLNFGKTKVTRNKTRNSLLYSHHFIFRSYTIKWDIGIRRLLLSDIDNLILRGQFVCKVNLIRYELKSKTYRIVGMTLTNFPWRNSYCWLQKFLSLWHKIIIFEGSFTVVYLIPCKAINSWRFKSDVSSNCNKTRYFDWNELFFWVIRIT